MKQLGELQLAILQLLWEQGEMTVAEVHEVLSREREIASTTVATVLSRLENQEIVTHRTEGRQYVYRPVVSRREVRRTMVGELLEKLFQGDPAALVSHLLRESEIDPAELAEVRALLEAAEGRKAEEDGR